MWMLKDGGRHSSRAVAMHRCHNSIRANPIFDPAAEIAITVSSK